MSFRYAAWVLLAASLAACSGPDRDPAQQLRAQVPAAAALLDKGGNTTWLPSSDGTLAALPTGAPKGDLAGGPIAKAPAPRASVSLAGHYQDGYAIGIGGSSAFALRVKPVLGSGRVSIGSDGVAHTNDIQRGVDALHVVTADGIEEMLFARDPAFNEVAYDVERGSGIAKLRVVSEGYVEALDAQGRARLRSPMPVIIDAKGKRVAGAWTLEGDRLTARWSNEGLQFPIAVDPAWFATGAMAVPRAFFASALLTDSTVLAIGGYSEHWACMGICSFEYGATTSTEVFDPATATWTATGSLKTARLNHTATPLPNGTVMVIGGQTTVPSATTGFLASTEIYSNGAWTTGATLGTARTQHTATLFYGATTQTNPEVLVVGGMVALGTANSTGSCQSEVYSLSGTKFTNGPTTSIGHVQHTATLLGTGGVLVVGGLAYNCAATLPVLPSTPSKVVELLNPGASAFVSAGTLFAARFGHTTTLLPNGAVLVIGGVTYNNGNGPTQVTEYYVPATLPAVSTAWTTGNPTAGTDTNDVHAYHTTTLLASGQLVVYGGYDCGVATQTFCTFNTFSGGSTPQASTTAELSSVVLPTTPTTSPPSFSYTSEIGLPTANAGGVLLASDRVLSFGGGADGGGGTQDAGVGGATVINVTSQVVDENDAGFVSSTNLSITLTSPTLTPLPTLVDGGSTLTGAPLLMIADCDAGVTTIPTASGGYLVSETVSAQNLSVSLNRVAAPNPIVFTHLMTGHTATLLLDGTVLIAGGSSSTALAAPMTTTYYGDSWIFDPSTQTIAPVGGMTTARARHTATLLSNGKVLVVGGDVTGGTAANPTTTGTTEIYDPSLKAWSTGPTLTTPLDSHTATLLSNGTVLVAGGATSTASQLPTSWIFDPIALAFSSGPTLHSPRAGHTATLLPSGEVLIAGGYYLCTSASGYCYPTFEAYQGASFEALDTGNSVALNVGQTATLQATGDVFYFGGGQLNPAGQPIPTSISSLDEPTLFSRSQGTATDFIQQGDQFLFQVPVLVGGASQLLPSGRTLIAGGLEYAFGGNNYIQNGINTALVTLDLGRAFLESERPVLNAPASSVAAPGASITLGGSQLTGIPVTGGFNALASSGSSTYDSPTNFPLVQLQAVESGPEVFLPFSPAGGMTQYTSTATAATIPGSLTSGWYRLTVFANSIPSYSRYVSVGGPVLEVTPALTTLANTRLGTTHSAVITVTNTGASSLNAAHLSVALSDSTDFTIGGFSNTGTLSTNQSTTATVTFNPQSVGLKTTNVTVSSSDANIGTAVVVVKSTGIYPILSVSQDISSFPATRVGGALPTSTVTITNSGTDTLDLAGITPTDATDFTATQPSPAALAAGASEQVLVTFNPQSIGTKTTNVVIGSTDANIAPVALSYSGNGTYPQMTATASGLAFNNVRLGTAPAPTQTLTITNPGTDTLDILSVTPSNSTDFTLSNLPTGTLAAGASTMVTVTFNPLSVGAKSNTVTVTSKDASISPVAVTFTGTGTYPSLTITPTTAFGFPNTRVGTTAVQTLSVQLTNTGTDYLDLTTLTPALTNGTDFSSTALATGHLLAGSNTTITVSFKPQSTAGLKSGMLNITSSDSKISSGSVSFSGTAIYPGLAASSSTLAFVPFRLNTTQPTALVTITNSGNDTLDLSALRLSDAVNFSVTALTTTTLAGGASTTATVTFTPTTVGAKASTLTVASSDANITSVLLNFTGTAIYPTLSVAPGSFTFSPGVRVGSSATTTVTISNTGTDVLHLAPVSVTPATDFSVSTLTSTTLTTSGTTSSTTVTVTFAPSSAASKSATLSIPSSDPNIATVTVALAGTGIYPTMTATPPTFAFANTRVGASPSPTTTITISNGGSDVLHLSAPTNTDPTDFQISTAPATLGGGASANLTVTFAPQSAGSKATTITILSSDANISPVAISMTGLATYPTLGATAASPTFPNTRVATATPSTDVITITNSGTSTLDLTTPTLSNTTDFSFSTLPPATLAAGGTTTFTVAFNPATVGSKSTTLTVASSDANISSIQIGLSGTGIYPALSITPTTLVTFANTRVGTATPPTSIVTLTNNGTDVLTLSTIADVLSNTTDYTVSAMPTGTLAAGASATLTVTFKPAATGVKTATLTFTSSDSKVTGGVVSFTGTGIYPTLGVTPPTSPLGNVRLGAAPSPTATITISNGGSDVLHLSTATLSNSTDFSIPALSTTAIAAGGSTTLLVTFAPQTTGLKSTTLTVASSDANISSVMVSLSGTGIYPSLGMTAPSTPFANTRVGAATPPTMTATVNNTGTDTLDLSTAVLSDSTDFGVSALPATLAAGGSTTLTVTFKPQSTGNKSTTLTVSSSDATIAPAQVTFSGVGIYPALTVAPASLVTFPNTRLTATPLPTQAVTLTNSGTDVLAWSTLSAALSNTTDYAISALPTTGNLAAGANATLTLTFKPQAVGVKNETVTISSSDSKVSGGSASFIGTGIYPALSVTPTANAFAATRAGSTITTSITITNTGSDTLDLATPVLSNTTDFGVSALSSSSLSASTPGNSTTLTVTFKPQASGAKTATLTIASSDANISPIAVALSGTGIYPSLTLTPATTSLADTHVHGAPSTASLTLTNTGTDTLSYSTLSTTLSDATDFIVSGLPTTGALAAAGTSTITVTFQPESVGTKSTTLALASSDPNVAGASVSLSGIALDLGLTLTPSSLTFADTRLFGASSQITAALKNTGTDPISYSVLSATLSDSINFSVLGLPTTGSLGAGATVTLTILFTPLTVGMKNTTLTLASSDPTIGGAAISLSGVGTYPALSATSPSSAFGAQRLGATGQTGIVVTITNSGTDALDLTVPVLSDTTNFTVSNLPVTSLGAMVSTSVTVGFNPQAVGGKSATLTFASSDQTVAPVVLSFSGVGIYPKMSVQPSTSTGFGNQRINTASAPVSIVVTNTGSSPLDFSTSAGVALVLSDATNYALTGSLPALLDAGTSASLSLKFQPATTGSFAATLTINSSDANIAPQTISLSGAGTAPNAQLSATSLAFGPQPVGVPSTPQATLVTSASGQFVDTLNVTSAAVTASAQGGAADPADFVVTPPASGAIAPGSSGASWSVVFTPSTPARAEAATLTLQSDAGPLTVALTGTGIAPAVTATPTTLSFSAQPKGTSSQPQMVALTNTGAAPLNITGYGLSGANLGDFSVSTSATSASPPGPSTLAACTAQPCPTQIYFVVFSPSSLDAETASLTFQTSAGPVLMTLSGASVGAALAFTPNSLDFGSQRVGEASGAVTISVTNVSGQALVLNAFDLAGANGNDFSVAFASGSQTLPLTLNSGAQTTIAVTFTPSAVGLRDATLALGGSEQGTGTSTSGILLPLSGTGISPTLDVGPASLDFGEILVGSTSATQQVTIGNLGTDVLDVQQISLSGAGAASFALSGLPAHFPAHVAVGSTLTFDVAFTASTVSSAAANAVVTTDDPLGATAQVALTGTGVSSQLAVAPLTLAFGAARVGGASQSLSVTITNSGGGAGSLTSATVSGDAASDFTLAGLPQMPAVLSPGGAQSIVVLFTPSVHGDRTAQLVLGTDAGPATVQLTGSGLAAGIGVQPGTLDFGSMTLGSDAKLLSVQVTNTGDAPLDLSLLSIDGPSAAAFRTTPVPDAGPLAPTGTASFSVEYAPGAAASDTATLHLTSPDPSTAGVDVALKGVAVTPALTLTGPLVFTLLAVGGTSIAQAATITNTSGAPLVIESVTTTGDFAVTIAGLPLTLANMGTATAMVTFDPAKSGPTVGALSVFVEGQSTALATTQLSGAGQAAATGCGCSSSSPTDAGTVFELAMFGILALRMRRRRATPEVR